MMSSAASGWIGEWRRRAGGVAILAAQVAFFFVLLCGSPFRRYHPREGTTTVEQLIARLPETRKFAVVRRGDRDYIVWVGRVRGAIVSGPPVYVFDRGGMLLDRVGDSGDSDNAFVRGLHGEALDAPGMTADEVLAYCRQGRAGSRR